MQWEIQYESFKGSQLVHTNVTHISDTIKQNVFIENIHVYIYTPICTHHAHAYYKGYVSQIFNCM